MHIRKFYKILGIRVGEKETKEDICESPEIKYYGLGKLFGKHLGKYEELMEKIPSLNIEIKKEYTFIDFALTLEDGIMVSKNL